MSSQPRSFFLRPEQTLSHPASKFELRFGLFIDPLCSSGVCCLRFNFFFDGPVILPLANHRVLIVEDEIFIATNLEDIVRDARGKIVGPAMSAPEALHLAKSEPITAAILDVRLGNHDSLPVAQYLTDVGIPFVIHTGSADAAARSTRWPQAPIVSKPASSQTIVSAIINALGSSHTGVTTGRF